MNPDRGRAIDWSRVSTDYAKYRSGPPASFYERLHEHGVGLRGQRILDLGTGTGVLAREFARRGALVTGVDNSPGQIEAAIHGAADEGLAIEFRVGPAESTPFPAASFDAITANQCWHFFDGAKVVAEARRLLKDRGLLAVSDFFWLATRDPIAAKTEDLILKFNPAWTGSRWAGDLPARPELQTVAQISYEEPIAFTRESWRGRLRTCRAIGPALPAAEVAAFDAELRKMLEESTPERFEILHRVRVDLYRLG